MFVWLLNTPLIFQNNNKNPLVVQYLIQKSKFNTVLLYVAPFLKLFEMYGTISCKDVSLE